MCSGVSAARAPCGRRRNGRDLVLLTLTCSAAEELSGKPVPCRPASLEGRVLDERRVSGCSSLAGPGADVEGDPCGLVLGPTPLVPVCLCPFLSRRRKASPQPLFPLEVHFVFRARCTPRSSRVFLQELWLLEALWQGECLLVEPDYLYMCTGTAR